MVAGDWQIVEKDGTKSEERFKYKMLAEERPIITGTVTISFSI